jgi:predicted LPLAT superfamily acyltransferase
MCGFRSYPLAACFKLFQQIDIGKGMDFDIDIMVRLYWQGLQVKQFPVEVFYPKDGYSNFRIFKDNFMISCMHTHLFFGMIYRIPKLITRMINPEFSSHWAKRNEVGPVWGIRFVLAVYRILGRGMSNLILHPITLYYYLFQAPTRRASQQFEKHYYDYCASRSLKAQSFNRYKQLYSFTQSILDKFSVWLGDVTLQDIDFNSQAKDLARIQETQGRVFICAHFGNLEICRALSRNYPKLKINVLVFTEHAKRFNDALNTIHPEVSANLISIHEFDPALAIKLKDMVDRGEWVFIMGDRVSHSLPDKCISTEFLGETAQFPRGPFVLASLLEVPIHTIHCIKVRRRFRIEINNLGHTSITSRKDREIFTKEICSRYAEILQEWVIKYPHQWYNFFEFWGEAKT